MHWSELKIEKQCIITSEKEMHWSELKIDKWNSNQLLYLAIVEQWLVFLVFETFIFRALNGQTLWIWVQNYLCATWFFYVRAWGLIITLVSFDTLTSILIPYYFLWRKKVEATPTNHHYPKLSLAIFFLLTHYQTQNWPNRKQ